MHGQDMPPRRVRAPPLHPMLHMRLPSLTQHQGSFDDQEPGPVVHVDDQPLAAGELNDVHDATIRPSADMRDRLNRKN